MKHLVRMQTSGLAPFLRFSSCKVNCRDLVSIRLELVHRLFVQRTPFDRDRAVLE